jgi:bifunctional UDP-N-acetylglucosamine pyrophosphorylase / glucosamine-1-phosphate N-acetyltransferase
VPGDRSPLVVLVLAAGQSKRLRSKKNKLLHTVAGRPVVAHVLDVASALGPDRLVTVVGHQADQVRKTLDGQSTRFVLQREQRGTGHAVLAASRAIGQDDRATLLVLDGDLPALKPATLRRFIARHRRGEAVLSVLTAEPASPDGRARVVRDEHGRVLKIVQYRDASPAVKTITEVDCGIYCAAPGALIGSLKRLARKNSPGEQHVADAARDLVVRGEKVIAVTHHDVEEIIGVDTRQELSRATRTLYARKADAVQSAGVTVLDAASTWIDPRATIGRDTVIYPGVLIEGACKVGEDCLIGPGCHLTNMTVGRGAQIFDHCVMIDSSIGDGALVGPFARLRPGSVLDAGSRVGNFVELKKTRLGPGSKANHLAYLGDSTIGPSCNIGAGTITCNYDGTSKHPTVMGRGVFIGSDTQLVAPVTLGDGAYVGAGATITKDVPAGALALSRQPQKNIEGWVARRAKKSKKK